MDFELRTAKQKLEREQRDRKERARLKLESETKAKAEAMRQREAIESSQRSRRIEAARAHQILQHQTSVCPLRLISCQFSGDLVQAGNFPSEAQNRLRGLSDHESICRSRTAPCDSWGRSVMLKDMEIHRVSVHQKN